MEDELRPVLRSQSGPTDLGDPPLSSAVLHRLMTWFSPSYPIGAFSYSSGIEWAVEVGDIRDAETLRCWSETMLTSGAGYCDGIIFTQAHRATVASDNVAIAAIAELAAAFASSRERYLETTSQGRAFMAAARAAWPCLAVRQLSEIWDGPVAYPVAAGIVCAGHGIPLSHALYTFLYSVTANWISAGGRLIPLGQSDCQHVLVAIERAIAETAKCALTATLNDLGSATFRADLAGMRHETQYTRLFRS
jgi:urease accessory protein